MDGRGEVRGGMDQGMNDDWNGEDRRSPDATLNALQIIRSELEERDRRLHYRIEKLYDEQSETKEKIARWETSAAVIRWAAITTVGILGALATTYDWLKEHMK